MVQKFRRTECQLQPTEQAPGHHWFWVDQPQEALSQLKQAHAPSPLPQPPHQPPSPRRPPQLPPVTPWRPRKPNQPRNPQRQPELPVPWNPTLLCGAPPLARRARRQLQQDQHLARLHRLPKEAPEALRGRQPPGVPTSGGFWARIACCEGVYER